MRNIYILKSLDKSTVCWSLWWWFAVQKNGLLWFLWSSCRHEVKLGLKVAYCCIQLLSLCGGSQFTTEPCPLPCPLDCKMSPWGEWGLCDTVCGPGLKNRTARVNSWSSYIIIYEIISGNHTSIWLRVPLSWAYCSVFKLQLSLWEFQMDYRTLESM